MAFRSTKRRLASCSATARRRRSSNCWPPSCRRPPPGSNWRPRSRRCSATAPAFVVRLSSGEVAAPSLVLATGGKSIPKMGATGLSYRLAEQFGLAVTETRPALVPLTFEPRILETLAPLSGISTEAIVSANGRSFREALLFTHRGLSGPAILQASSYWRGADVPSPSTCCPDIAEMVTSAGRRGRRRRSSALQTVLAAHLPKRLAQMLAGEAIAHARHDRRCLRRTLAGGRPKRSPAGRRGNRPARKAIAPQKVHLGQRRRPPASASTTMQARSVPGLYVVGEAVDVGRLARRLQFPVGLGQRLGRRPGGLTLPLAADAADHVGGRGQAVEQVGHRAALGLWIGPPQRRLRPRPV